ncbi:MAG: aromatic ring-hydroxylating dioxygenase subunit alpha [Acidimicrobiales bacterium]
MLDGDATAPPSVLRAVAEPFVGDRPIDVARYVSPAFAALERDRLWSNVWQFACRVEHLPEVGDHLLYEVGDLSLIVVRSDPQTIRAFHNSCLHRGTTLVEGKGNTAIFKCLFHGFAWSIDGTFRSMPAAWDFEHVDRSSLCLPEAAVAIWGGFVFVHPGAEPEPFESFAGPLIEHFAQHPLDGRYVAHHACQVVDANWKTTQEAFMEGYHVPTTHPHTVRFANDFDIQYDTFGPNVNRLMQAIAVPASGLIGTVPPAEIATTVQKLLPAEDRRPVPDDLDEASVRNFLGEVFRASFSRRWRADLAAASEAELLDSVEYFLFPNFSPWIGYSIPIAYRFRPWGDDPNRSLMEIMLLHPIPEDGDYTVAAEHWLEPGESWSHAPGFELLGMVIDQDMANLPKVQKGLRAARQADLITAAYQEVRLRHYHHRLDVQLGLA